MIIGHSFRMWPRLTLWFAFVAALYCLIVLHHALELPEHAPGIAGRIRVRVRVRVSVGVSVRVSVSINGNGKIGVCDACTVFF